MPVNSYSQQPRNLFFDRMDTECDAESASEFSVIVTHDVDRTTLLEPSTVLKVFLEAVGFKSSLGLPLASVFSNRSVLRIVEQLLEIECASGIGAIFFMMAGPYDCRRLGTRTDIRWKTSRELGRMVIDADMQVGLHSSAGACERNSYPVEKDSIEQFLGVSVNAHRSHYLRFDPLTLPAQLEAAGIAYDFSFKSAHGMGFRGGHAHACRAYHFPDKRSARVMSIPLLFMDTAFLGQDPSHVLRQLRCCLEQVKAVQGCVSLLFHPEWFLTSHAPFALFEGAIELCQEMGADLSGKLPTRWWDQQQADGDVERDGV